jgi:hypothetical protein
MTRSSIVCVERRGTPTFNAQGDVTADYTHIIVLKAGQANDYAAYEGIVPTDVAYSDAALDWVAAHGNKVSFALAECYFPVGLEESKYRR